MKDNAFGTIMKLLLVLWSAWSLWTCAAPMIDAGRTLHETARTDAERDAGARAAAPGVLVQMVLSGGLWFAGCLPLSLAYFVFGRSKAS